MKEECEKFCLETAKGICCLTCAPGISSFKKEDCRYDFLSWRLFSTLWWWYPKWPRTSFRCVGGSANCKGYS